MAYAPEKVYTDKEGLNRRYDEMWTGDWWWEMQVSYAVRSTNLNLFPFKTKLPAGATISPIILASDKTNLSRFGGDKQAWPVYMTIGNISKDIRRRPSSHGSVLIGYLPVAKLLNFPESTRSNAVYRLYHQSMRILLQPLVNAGTEGVDMTCADGLICRVFPILAAFIADHPEQCLIACCKENYCPRCNVMPNDRGECTDAPLRTAQSVRFTLYQQQNGEDPLEFEDEGLREVFSPFWADLPHCDIFQCITPDILHQLHKGAFKDHLVKWCTRIIGEAIIDDRFRAMSSHPELRHFKKGISSVSQWTGKEHKEMQKVFLGVLAGAAPSKVLAAARGLLDFIYYAQYQAHTTETLHHMQESLDLFHANKDAFIDLNIREHFNIPKLHSMCHYVASIRNLGSVDGLNSEGSERLHIDYAKKGYHASNKNDFIPQMAKWLQRHEAIDLQSAYLQWHTGCLPLDEIDSDGDGPELDMPDTPSGSTYYVAQSPAFPSTPLPRLIDAYGASEFLPALKAFLQENFTSTAVLPKEHDCFDVYKSLYIMQDSQPHVSDCKHLKTIFATPERSNGSRKQPSPARFDTALVIEDTGLHSKEGGLHGR